MSFLLGRNRSSKKTQFLPITSSLCKVLRARARGSSDPLVGDLQVVAWSPRIRGPPGADTTRRLEVLEPSTWSAWGCSSRASGVYPIFSSVVVFAVSRSPTSSGSMAGGVGGDEETRTPDPLLAKEMLFRLSYVPLHAPASGRYVVGVSGLEPETSALSGQCSNQLS